MCVFDQLLSVVVKWMVSHMCWVPPTHYDVSVSVSTTTHCTAMCVNVCHAPLQLTTHIMGCPWVGMCLWVLLLNGVTDYWVPPEHAGCITRVSQPNIALWYVRMRAIHICNTLRQPTVWPHTCAHICNMSCWSRVLCLSNMVCVPISGCRQHIMCVLQV